MEKNIQNANTVAQKLEPVSTKSNKFKEKRGSKKQKVIDKQKIDIIVGKQHKKRERYNWFIEDNRYDDSEISSTDSDQEDGLSNSNND